MTHSADHDLVVVYQSADLVMASLSVSCLERAGIPFMTRNQDIQNLIGVGTFGTGFNVVSGPFELVVTADRANEARDALQDLFAVDAEKQRNRGYEEFKEVSTIRQIGRIAIWLVIIMTVVSGLGMHGNIALAVALFLLGTMSITIGYGYWHRMRTLGYEWAEIGDANWILLHCRRKAFWLPPAADVETVPGSTHDCEGIIEFLNALAAYKRAARKNR